MSRQDHHAIVIGVGDYLLDRLDLEGPVNDAQAFCEWLRDPLGGDLEPQNIHSILSTDYPANSGHPKPNELEELFEPLVVAGVGGRYPNGKRLYIYAAGHGFSDPHNLTATALYAANAQNTFQWHIALTYYAEWLAAHAVFDEIALIMDCCRTVVSPHAIRVPQFPDIPPHPNAHQVRVFKAFAVGAGRKAREKIFPDGRYHGIFTQTLLRALEVTEPVDGKVTGTLLENKIHNLIDGIAGPNVPVDPPKIDADPRRDIVFLERQAAGRPTIEVVLDPHNGQETLIWRNSEYKELGRQAATTPSITLYLEPAIYVFAIENDDHRQKAVMVANDEQIIL